MGSLKDIYQMRKRNLKKVTGYEVNKVRITEQKIRYRIGLRKRGILLSLRKEINNNKEWVPL